MKTYKLTTEKEIRKEAEQFLKVSDAKDYCQRLASFFEQKLEDIIELFTDIECYGEQSSLVEKAEDKLYKKYHVFNCDAYDLEEAFENYKLARDHYKRLSGIVDHIVRIELLEPTIVELEEEELDLADVHLCWRIDIFNKYSEDIMPLSIRGLYEKSYGIDKAFEQELDKFLNFYDLKN